MLQFDSFTFFANLFIVFVVVVPVYRSVSSVVFRRLFLGLVGLYLLWLIAPRLAVFYLAFWSLAWVLQRVVGFTAERRLGTPVFAAAVVMLLAPMVIWKLWTTGF